MRFSYKVFVTMIGLKYYQIINQVIGQILSLCFELLFIFPNYLIFFVLLREAFELNGYLFNRVFFYIQLISNRAVNLDLLIPIYSIVKDTWSYFIGVISYTINRQRVSDWIQST